MCGIVAVFAYHPSASPISARELVGIRDAMVVRGPDAAGLWIAPDARVGLAHRRLTIIDISVRANQPMVRPETETRITFNGEIYNYRELRAGLLQRGHVFHTESDTEVLLHAYDAYGTDMVRYLRGMYAFAIWDPRRNGLFLARDPFGVKPLYYADDGKRILVASQVKALRASIDVDDELSPAGQVSFLLWGSIIEPHTLFRGIKSVPAGSTMWIDQNGAHAPAVFWSVTEVFREAEYRRAGLSDAETARPAAVDVMRSALVDSLRHHMVSDVPVGVFLSGGLDSATLVGLASENRLGDLRTVTLGVHELTNTPQDEVGPAQAIASTYGVHHTAGWIGSAEFAHDRERLLREMDQPTVDGVNVYFVSKIAHEAGLKVALSGLGGDELLGGYPSFGQIPKLVGALRPFASVPQFGKCFRRVSAPLLKHFTSPKYAGLFEYGTSVEDAYLLRRGLFMPWELPDMLGPEVAKKGWDDLAPRAQLKMVTGNLSDTRTKISLLEMANYMRNQLLRDSDWAGMAHSLEIRVPFVDHVLLQELAPFLVGPQPLTKADMVRTLRRPLPLPIVNRRKSGFAVPVRDWLMKDQAVESATSHRRLRGWAKYILADQSEKPVPMAALTDFVAQGVAVR